MRMDENINVEAKLVEIEARAKSNTRRIDKLEQSTEAIHAMAVSLEGIARDVKHTGQIVEKFGNEVEKVDNKITELQQKPAKRWDTVVGVIISAVVTGLIAFAMVKLGLK